MTVLFEDDSGYFHYPPYPMERAQLANYVQRHAGKGIDIFAWDFVVNGVCFFDSKVGPGVLEGQTTFPHESIRNYAANIRHLIDSGADPLTVVVEESHRLGMKMFASIRPTLFIPSPEKIKSGGGIYYNPVTAAMSDKTIKNLPEVDGYYTGWGSTAAPLDWSYSEVRQLNLDLIQEMAHEYDVDGISINYIRSVVCFEADQAPDKAPIMTEFIRKVREILDNAARHRGKDHLSLAVRVPDDLEICRRYGLDVGTWIKEQLADFVMPSHAHGINVNAPVEEFASLCCGTECQLMPTLQPNFGPLGTSSSIRPEQLRGVAHHWYRRGAHGISAFNFPAAEWTREFGDPSSLATGTRLYPFDAEPVAWSRSEVGTRKTIEIPELPAAALSEPMERATLRLQAQELSWDDELEIDVDGTPVTDVVKTYTSGPAYQFDSVLPAVKPYHQVGIRLAKRADIATNVQIKDVSLTIEGAQPRRDPPKVAKAAGEISALCNWARP